VDSENDPECGIPWSYLSLVGNDSEDLSPQVEYYIEEILDHGTLDSGETVFLTVYRNDVLPSCQAEIYCVL
jgi:hypothetical protein